jgi:hypothetical protein
MTAEKSASRAKLGAGKSLEVCRRTIAPGFPAVTDLIEKGSS